MVFVLDPTGQIHRLRVGVWSKPAGRLDRIAPAGILGKRINAGILHSAGYVDADIGDWLARAAYNGWVRVIEAPFHKKDNPGDERYAEDGDYEPAVAFELFSQSGALQWAAMAAIYANQSGRSSRVFDLRRCYT